MSDGVSIYPAVGSVWQHYKGALYVVQCVVVQETDEKLAVVYYPVVDPPLFPWCRPFSEWHQWVAHDTRRFTKVVYPVNNGTDIQ